MPDAGMLTRIAELFEVSVSELLGAKINQETNVDEVAQQLQILNEYLANRSRRRRRLLRNILIGILIFNGECVIVTVLGLLPYSLVRDAAVAVT